VTNEIHSICFTVEDGNFSIDPEVLNISCYGEDDGFIDLNISGGTPPYIIDWSDGVTVDWNDGLNFGNDERENLPAGTISVDIFDANMNCVIQEEFLIIEPLELTVPPPILLEVLGGWNTSCEEGCDGSIQVNIVGGTAPYNYFWNGVQVITGSFNDAEIVNDLCAGEGQLGIIDSNGCQVLQNITLDAPPQMIVNVDSYNDVSCSEAEEGIINDGSINISVTGGQPPYSYSWYNEDGDLISTDEDINGLIEGDYTVIVNDINGNEACGVSTDPNPFPIEDPFNFEIIMLSLADGPAACIDANDGFITLDPTGGTPFQDENEEYYYTYFLNGEGPNILYVDDIVQDEDVSINGIIDNLTVGEYEVIIYDSNGCQITHNFELDSIQESCLGFIPTVFTPNGTGQNETWIIPDLIFYPDATVQVYNRWGQLVFECKNNCYFNVWDGTNDDGENLPFGNYYFLINYKENEKPIYGAVTIKR
jgi:gliding motility-associated-like protein